VEKQPEDIAEVIIPLEEFDMNDLKPTLKLMHNTEKNELDGFYE